MTRAQEEREILRRFGIVIRLRRKALELSQEELAARAKLDRAHLGEIERGRRNVSLLAIVRIAKALEVEGPDFIFRAMRGLDPQLV